jgi:NAD(P)-dependent dehydrogenase (short-subunit alcohol dehydrogenase family)
MNDTTALHEDARRDGEIEVKVAALDRDVAGQPTSGYVSSGTHHGVRPRMDDLLWAKRAWSGFSAYAESKLCDVLLAFAVARRWKDVKSNALEPGWVPTRLPQQNEIRRQSPVRTRLSGGGDWIRTSSTRAR